jgi:hypothetical protein
MHILNRGMCKIVSTTAVAAPSSVVVLRLRPILTPTTRTPCHFRATKRYAANVQLEGRSIVSRFVQYEVGHSSVVGSLRSALYLAHIYFQPCDFEQAFDCYRFSLHLFQNEVSHPPQPGSGSAIGVGDRIRGPCAHWNRCRSRSGWYKPKANNCSFSERVEEAPEQSFASNMWLGRWRVRYVSVLIENTAKANLTRSSFTDCL